MHQQRDWRIGKETPSQQAVPEPAKRKLSKSVRLVNNLNSQPESDWRYQTQAPSLGSQWHLVSAHVLRTRFWTALYSISEKAMIATVRVHRQRRQIQRASCPGRERKRCQMKLEKEALADWGAEERTRQPFVQLGHSWLVHSCCF